MTYKEAVTKAAGICSRNEKCEFDIRKKLDSWDLNNDDTDKVIQYLKEEKYIDHQRYAIFFIRDKFRFNKWGKRKIGYELKLRLIEEEIIKAGLENIPEDEYKNTLTEILEQKLKGIKNKDYYRTKASLIRFASSRGFETDIIYNIVDSIIKP